MEENNNIIIEDLTNATEEQLQDAQAKINNQLELLTNKRIAWEEVGEKIIDYCRIYGGFKAVNEGITLDFVYKEEDGFKYSPDFSIIGTINQARTIIESEEEDIVEKDSNEIAESNENSSIEQYEIFETNENVNSENNA